MNSQNNHVGITICLRSLKPASLQLDSQPLGFRYLGSRLPGVRGPWAVLLMLLLLVAAMGSTGASAQPAPPASPRITVNLSQGVPTFVGNTAATDPNAALPQSNWWYENNQDNTAFAATSYGEVATPIADSQAACGSTLSAPNWTQVGIPTDANIWRTFINQASGGGQGSVCGQNNWYRLHFTVSPTYASSKIMVEIEGAHTGAQVYINGTLLPGISAVGADSQASHVVGFIPFIVDLTPYIKADGATENVLAVRISRGSTWYEDPGFSEVFRYGQAMAGLFRPVKMFITNKVHIPVNVYSNQKTWGTYVATVSEVPSATSTAQAASAVIQVETNVLNETTTSQTVTLTTQIVDENGNVVATGAPLTQTVAPMTPGNFPSTATPMFNQQITVNNPTLWYPNNSIYGTPYMYTVNHIVSVNGAVVDVAQTPLGIRTITWNTNYPIFNGYPMNLWGASGRYDYPGLGSSVPEEQQWRDLSLLAAEGGNIYRPGHSSSSEEFVNAADAYGIMIDQPSGDNEEAFAAPTADSVTLKEELHRDMIVRDRSHPSILDWESNNGTMEESVGTALLAINSQWDPINTRIAADRTPDPVNGYLLGCTLEGCEVGIKSSYPNYPAWGSEYWGTGTARGLAWNYEIAFVAPFLGNWRQSRAADAMGMAQWYFADTPGETGQYVEAGASTTAPGNANAVRSLGASSVDQNRFPKLLYYVYEAAWTPFSIKPVVHLSGHWNYSSGNVQVNAFSNCPSVKLLVNGVQQGAIETPNLWTSNDSSNQTETDTLIPFQTSWNVPWASGTVTADCLNGSGTVVATDSRTTAGAENKIVLSVTPELTKPGSAGTTFQVTANGSDAAFVTATIEDANGNWEPLASDTLTFSVSGPATYQGGTQQYVSANTDAYSNANSTYVNGVPDAFYMAPGDPQLAVEGGLTKIALRSQFTPGTVTVTATAPGLTSGSASYTIVAVPDPRTAVNNCTTIPSAPTGLGETTSTSTVAPYAGVVSLTWTTVTPPANCAIGFYNIYSSTASGFTPSSSNEIASGITSASYSATGLASSTTYYFIVEAVDADGTSAASAQIAATTPVTPACTTLPSAPTGLTAAASSASAIGLTWTAPTPPAYCTISSYSVYGGTTANPTALIASGLTGTTYSNTGLAATTTYYYVVKAVDADGTSAASAQASASTQAAGSVSINAGGPAVSNSGGGDNSFVADEDYSTGGTTYSVPTPITIPASVTNAAPAAVYQDARQGAVTYTIPGLTAGTSYIVRLHFAELYFSAVGGRVFNVAINGTAVLTNFDIVAAAGAQYTAAVEQFTATPNSGGNIVIVFTAVTDQPMINGIEVFGASTACTTVPSAPTGLTATASSSSAIGLSWTAVTPPANCSISSYNVYGGTTANPTTLIASGVTGTTYSNTGLTASTTYYYVVKAVDADGTSAASNQAQTATLAVQACTSVPPTGPTSLTANATSSSVIALSWPAGFANPPCTVTSYNVFRSTTNGFTPGSGNLIASGVTGTAYSDTGLAASSTYYYLVETLDSYGASAASPQATATTQPSSSGTSIVSINAGGPAVSNSGGGDNSFAADEDFSTGGALYSVTNTITIPASIASTAAPAAVYQTAREGATTYTIPNLTPGSSYTVRLHFAELYFTAAGNREFNVAINGTAALTNFDIYATASARYTAVVENFTAMANSGGQIVIAFANGAVNQPEFEGIEVLGSSTGCSTVPSAPTGLTATASSSSAISLGWTAVTPPANCLISSYTVYGGTTANPTTVIASGVTGTTYSNTGLAASTTYYYVVKAVDADGTSAASAQAQATTPAASCTTVPSAPTGLTATASSSSAIGLGWTAVTPPANCSVSSYTVFGGTTANPTTVIASGVTGTTYSNTGLAASTTYYYVVKAVDADGTSAASTQATATTQPPSSDKSIVSINAGGPAVSNSGGGDNSFVADEDYVGGTTYAVTNTITIPASIATTAAPVAVYQTAREGATTYTIPNLTPGSSYTVRLHFAELYFTVAGNREFNVVINGTAVLTNFDIYATAGARYTAVVENFTATASSGGQIVIAFTNGAVNQPEFEGIEVLGSSTGCSAVPSAPTGLTATASSSSAIGLGWTAVTPPANCTVRSYTVYGGTTANPTTVIASGVTGTTYSNTGLAASTTYYYVVKALDADGTSAASAQAQATTPAASCTTLPSAPTGLTATASSSSAIGLGWTAVTPPANCSISSYTVYGGTTANPTTVIASGLTGTTYSNTGLAASTTYYYVVKAVDVDGTSAASAQATATTQASASNTGYVSINAGGAAVSNSGGGDNPFVADEDYSAGGTTYSVANAITIPSSIVSTAAPMAVYQTARQGAVTYTIPNLTAGTSYIARLHFAELYFSAAGGRQFNVAINGTAVLTNFDIYKTAGANYTAVVENFTATANGSGQIVIAFTGGAADQPMFNGIEILDATPCTTIPSAPTGLTATASYPSVIGLTWTATTPPANCSISSYNVYGGTTANPTTVIASGLTGTTYPNKGLAASTTYYYVVKAVDADGTSAASAQATTTTPAYAVIALPTSLTAVGSSYQQIDLRWVASTAPAPNTSPVNYSVYRSTTTPFTPSAANLVGTTVGITNYLDSNYPATLTAGESSIPPGPGIQPSATYYYMVVASTLSGASQAATASATSLPATPSTAAPAALTGLAAMAENANEIDLMWNSTNSGVGTVATTYYIYRSTTSPFTPAANNLIGTTKSNWFQDALCTASTQYYYHVLANNTIGVSPSSTTVTAITPALNPNLWGGAPFWDGSGLPAKQNVVMMKFLNRTNGQYTNSQIIWTADINGVASQYTIAQQPYYDMPANSSGRMYFFLNDPTLTEDNTDYWDYIEFTVGPTFINMDTTRVDALGVKIAFNLTCGDGTNVALGENQQVFTEDRSVTFQRYLNAVPSTPGGDFQSDEIYAPYRIIEPGGAGFNAGGADQNYYANYISSIWSFNGITIPQAGPNGSNLGANPDLSGAIFRHTAPISGTPEFNAAGNLTNQGMWGNPASFYQQEPYDHYAQWIEAQAINMQQYAFPYNDAGGYSADIGCQTPETLLVAVGW